MELASPLPPRVRRSSARLGLILTALIVLVAGYGVTKAGAFRWFLLRASLRSQFPRVQWITSAELADWQENQERQPPLVFDVRTVEEWRVSRLPSATRVEPGSSVDAIAPNISKDASVVAYCAIGYRSAALVKRMTMAGYTHAQVLDGGIFAWANEHHPLVRDNQRATQVHPYTQFWGRLLDDDIRARPPYN